MCKWRNVKHKGEEKSAGSLDATIPTTKTSLRKTAIGEKLVNHYCNRKRSLFGFRFAAVGWRHKSRERCKCRSGRFQLGQVPSREIPVAMPLVYGGAMLQRKFIGEDHNIWYTTGKVA